MFYRWVMVIGVLVCVGVGERAAFAACQVCGGCAPGTSACSSDGLLNCAPLCTNTSFNMFIDCDDTGCPATEVGQCDDGMNNDAWVDGLTDAADPDCQCPSGGAGLVLRVDNRTGAPQTVTFTGDVADAACWTGTASYSITGTCGPGLTTCATVAGLRSGVWRHRVTVGAQQQATKTVVVAGAPGAGANTVEWTAFKSVMTVDNPGDASSAQCPSPPGQQTCTLRRALAASESLTASAAPLLVQFSPAVFPPGVATAIQLDGANESPLEIGGSGTTIDATDLNGDPTFRGDPHNRIVDLPPAGGTLVFRAQRTRVLGLFLRRPPQAAGATPDDVVRFRGDFPTARSALLNARIDGGGGALTNPSGSCQSGKLDQHDCVSSVNHAGQSWGDAPSVRNTELTGCPDKAVKVTSQAYLRIVDSWLHQNIGGGIQATQSGNVEAVRTLVEDSGFNAAQQQIYPCASGLSANGASGSTPDVASSLQASASISRGNASRGAVVSGLSEATIADSVMCGNDGGDARNGVAILSDQSAPAAVVRGTAMVLNGRHGASVATASAADFGAAGSAGDNAFAGNAASVAGANFSSAAAAPVSAIGNQWERCYATPATPGALCDGDIAADIVGTALFAPAQPHRAAAADLPVQIDGVSPPKAAAGALIHISGSGFNAIDSYPAGGNCGLAIQQNNRCNPLTGNCVEVEVAAGRWESLAVIGVTPTQIVAQLPSTASCVQPMALRVRRRDHADNVVSAVTTFCTSPCQEGTDVDQNGVPDACQFCPKWGDADADGVCAPDNCPTVSNPGQGDSDADGVGDACDACVGAGSRDSDGDGVCDGADNCPVVANGGQGDGDGDGIGDLCDDGLFVHEIVFSESCPGSGPGAGVNGLAFDGEHLWFACLDSSFNLFRADPLTGVVDAAYAIGGDAGGYRGLAYDATRHAIWALRVADTAADTIFLDGAQAVTGKATTGSLGAVGGEGLAFDARGLTSPADDRLYVIQQDTPTITAFALDGAASETFPWITGAITGLALGGNLLFEGSGFGANVISAVDKVSKALDFDFGTGTHSPGDLECDTVTFGSTDTHVLWAADPESSWARAYAVPFGSCASGGSPSDAVSAVVGAGGSAGTDGEADGATPADPIETTVTSPNPGTIAVAESAAIGSPPGGFAFLGQQVSIVAPPASVATPLIVTFRIDAAQLGGTPASAVVISKGGAPVGDCAGPPGQAVPDPCVAGRATLPDGDAEITVRTTTTSLWRLAGPAAAEVCNDAVDNDGDRLIDDLDPDCGLVARCDDADGDVVCDASDNCATANADQSDIDFDGVGDACDLDTSPGSLAMTSVRLRTRDGFDRLDLRGVVNDGDTDGALVAALVAGAVRLEASDGAAYQASITLVGCAVRGAPSRPRVLCRSGDGRTYARFRTLSESRYGAHVFRMRVVHKAAGAAAPYAGPVTARLDQGPQRRDDIVSCRLRSASDLRCREPWRFTREERDPPEQ